MSPRLRTTLYVLGLFVVCVILMGAFAISLGANPFNSDRSYLWVLSVFVALYASFRVVTTVQKMMRSTSFKGLSMPGISKKQHAIDKRMAERRARLEAAKERQSQVMKDEDVSHD